MKMFLVILAISPLLFFAPATGCTPSEEEPEDPAAFCDDQGDRQQVGFCRCVFRCTETYEEGSKSATDCVRSCRTEWLY